MKKKQPMKTIVCEAHIMTGKEFIIWWKSFKNSLKCGLCPENRWMCLEFHHVDPTKKEYTISHLVGRKKVDLFFKEITKCAVVCANCHRVIHHSDRFGGDIEGLLTKLGKITKLSSSSE